MLLEPSKKWMRRLLKTLTVIGLTWLIAWVFLGADVATIITVVVVFRGIIRILVRLD